MDEQFTATQAVPPEALALPAEVAGSRTDGPAPHFPQNYRRTVALVLIAAVGMYVMALTLNTTLSLRIAAVAPEAKEAALSAAVSFTALLQLVFVPLAGALSDRTGGRFGRRRPWIVGMLVPALITMAVIGTTGSIPVIIVAYVIGATAAQLGFSSFAIIPVEAVPDHVRGRVMGLMGMFGALALSGGSFLAAALFNVPLLMMTAPVLLAIACSLPLLLLYRDPMLPRAELPAENLTGLFKGLFVNPRKHPDFAWVWLSRFCAGAGFSAMFTYFVYFMVDKLQVPLPEVGAQVGLLTLLSAPVSVVFFTLSGWWSDKVGRRKPFVMGGAGLLALGLVVAATAHSFTQFLVAWLIFAMGQAMYLTVDLALCAAVLPNSQDVGKDMGVFQLALSLPSVVVPMAAPSLLAVAGGHNYLLLWGVAAAICVAGAFTVAMVKGTR